MILVYPVGVPLLYWVMLQANKFELANRDDETLFPPVVDSAIGAADSANTIDTADSATGATEPHPTPTEPLVPDSAAPIPRSKDYAYLSNSVQRISFLWDAYEPRFWYVYSLHIYLFAHLSFSIAFLTSQKKSLSLSLFQVLGGCGDHA
jgi:hypothetical protein